MTIGSDMPEDPKDHIDQSSDYLARDQFIATVKEDAVCRLASFHHNGDRCNFFKPPSRGSYNICYFVRFTSTDSSRVVEKWVVRVPLAPCLAQGGKSKLESEIATMQLVAEKTSIPLPKIHAFRLGDDAEPLSSYIILEYIEGEKFSYKRLKALSDEERQRFYTSMADIYIQLRRLEFPAIGCLVQGQAGYAVEKRTTSIDINKQELEGLQPSKIQDCFYNEIHGERRFLTSAEQYISMLLRIADNAFANGRDTVFNREQGEDALYHLHIFREYAQGWMNPRLERGPFVLVHGDLEPFNLIVNERMEIASVLDWEWSRVVPLQFFLPPLWLRFPDTTKMAWDFVYREYSKSLDGLLEIVRQREHEQYGTELLSTEWDLAKENSGFLVANALENWTDMDWFANRYINWKCYQGKADLNERVKAFMEQDPARKRLIDRKVTDGIALRTELDNLKNTSLASNPVYSSIPTSAFSTIRSFFIHHMQKISVDFSLDISHLALGAAIIVPGISYLLVKRLARNSSG